MKKHPPSPKHRAFITSIVATAICFSFLTAYFVFHLKAFQVDEIGLKIFFAGLFCLLLGCVSKLKVGEFEIENLQKEVKIFKDFVLRGEVIRTFRGETFFIDNAGLRYSIPDDHTLRFFRSGRGELIRSDEDLEDYPPGGQLESVTKCELLKSPEGHLFAVINNRKYHIPSASYASDWGRKDEFKDKDDVTIRNIPLGR